MTSAVKLLQSLLQTRQVSAWQALYNCSATKQSWKRAHRWSYSDEVAQRTIDDIRNKLCLQSAQRILEVGCGCGIVCNSLLRDGQKAVGLDLSEELLRRASDFGVNQRKVALVAAEATRLPLCDASFDRVLCYSVFQCFPSKRYAKWVLEELMRVCQPGGIILVGDIFERTRVGPIWSFCRILLGGLHALRLRAWLLARPFKKTTIEKELSDRYVLRQYYSKRFFEKVLRGRDCDVELLPQKIAGREMVGERFDVRIVKDLA